MEKLTMKLTIKIALVISLFCATAFAGDQTNGGFCGDQTNGGGCLASNPTGAKTIDAKDQKDVKDDLLVLVRNFLAEIFG
jgi:uncharacterized protein YdeI (BOF family)